PVILDAWYPGQEGGSAIANVIFGDFNPAGRLPVSVPKSLGQIPVYYNYWFPNRRDYVETDAKPLYPFGYGLSYSEFKYSDLKVATSGKGRNTKIEISLKISNTSKVDGDEVIQLYIRDMVSTVLSPVKQLRAFERVSIKAGETKTVQFELLPKELSLFDTEMKQKVQAGEFKLMIGASSEDIRLETTFKIPETIILSK
ncbi:MAG TPA: beta-glucosidase, partial [Zunongwangia profunda]|nr:beta-glucosidase [Zunongwangia profunda]